MSLTSRTRYLAAATALLVLPGLIAGVPASAAPAPGASGVGDSFYPLDGNGGIDVQHYRIRQNLDFGRKRLSGSTVVTLRTTQDLSSFNLDFLLPVRKVTVNGAAAHTSRPSKHELTIRPREPLAAGTVARVKVTYSGKPGAQSYLKSIGDEHNFIATREDMMAVNEPHVAPWWFPANDHPTDRARFDVITSVPRGKQVIGNGRLVSKKNKGSRTVWRWRAAEPMASYLAYFVAGDYVMKKGKDASGRPSWYAVSKGLSGRDQKAALKRLLRTPRLTRWLERKLGRAYPFSSNGGVVVGTDLGFALENQTRPVYSWWGADMDGLMIHELAHQWFGDLITVSQWREIWLNEGFATYFQWVYEAKQARVPLDDVLRTLWRGYGAGDMFWKIRIADPSEPKLFDNAIYYRGGMTLIALRNRVGNAAFRKILQTWIDEYRGRSVASADFEALATRVSGQDLSGFFTAWLRTSARPANTSANGLGPWA